MASATITPTLTVTPTNTTAGTNPATVGFDAKFAPTTVPTQDGVKDLTFSLPSGLIANANLAGGACLISTAPQAACQVGTGTVTENGTPGTPVTVSLYLVQAPKAGDAGGVAMVAGTSPSGRCSGSPG